MLLGFIVLYQNKDRTKIFLSHIMLQHSKQQLGALGKAAWRAIFPAFDILQYTFTYPWRDSYFAVTQAVTNPERYLEQWIKVRQAEYAFIGLVVRASSHDTITS
jgi:hypothetical protein